MSARFELPPLGPPTAVQFPDVRREELPNGLKVLSIVQPGVPVVSAALIVEGGSANDPRDRPGLASLVADLTDEGAGGRDALQLADALARLGSHVEVDVGPDVTAISVATLSRFLTPVLSLVADIVARPHLSEMDLTRVRELRLSRLRQLSRSPAAAADRAFLLAVLGDHPYGHGGLGTTRSLEAITLDEARQFWAAGFSPARSTLIVAGEASGAAVMAAARSAFTGWIASGETMGSDPDWREPGLTPELSTISARPTPGKNQGSDPAYAKQGQTPPSYVAGQSHVLVVDRPGAPQSELRIGHLGPARQVEDYHALVTLNAVLGGQFTSRINRNLRETRGITYGARTAFDMRRAGGTFACDTSVQGDATAVAVREILGEMEAIRGEDAVGGEELEAAKASLTRGYVRHFETAAQLTRAMAQLVTYGLDRDAFDRFVPEVETVTSEDLARVAREFVHPATAAIVIVGDARHAAPLEEQGRQVVQVTPEF